MKCAGCGKEIAHTAHYCDHCGAKQPTSGGRMAQAGGEAVAAAGAASVSTSSPRRGASIAFTIGTVLAVALVAVAAWWLLDHGSGPLETRATGETPVSVPSGAVPPPADQSAAPLPPAEPLPPVDAGNAAEEGGGTSAAASGTSTMEESSEPVSAPATPAAGERPAGAAKGAAPRARGATATKAARPAKPVHPAPAAAAAAAPPSSASPTANAAQAPAAPPVNDHWARMDEDMAKCTREDFINRVICAQRVKYRYCPGYWGKVPQCPGSPASEHE